MHLSAAHARMCVVVLGAGIVATGPTVTAPAAVVTPDLTLTAGIDPISPWVDTFETASANASALWDQWASAPFPLLQQFAVNQLHHLEDVVDNPANLGGVVTDIGANLRAVLALPFTADTDLLTYLADGTVDVGLPDPAYLGHYPQFAFMHTLADGDTPVQSLLDFTASRFSGLLLGAAGPVVSPLLAFADTVRDVAADLGATDVTGALNDVINLPATLTGAVLNGYGQIDVLPLVELLGISLPSLSTLPGFTDAEAQVTALDVAMGGLLSPGGVLFDALGIGEEAHGVLTELNAPFNLVDFYLPGHPAGLPGTVIELTQAAATAIGWDGTALPLDGLALPSLDPTSLLGVLDLGNLLGNFDLGNLLDLPAQILAMLTSMFGL